VGIGGVQRLVTLPPAPESARHARRFVTEVLDAAGAASFADTAVLLTSELVTNGIVHAHTDLRVAVEATPRWVRVEVADGSTMLPSRRSYDEQALTGRGLEMIELLADGFGVESLDDDGKRVWFRLGATPHDDDRAAPAVDDTHPDELAVLLVNLPVVLYTAWQTHADAMLREATLIALDRGPDALPEDLVLASQALGVLAGGTTAAFDRVAAPQSVDVEIGVPRALVGTFAVLRDVLRRCGERARAGELLTPASLPEIQAVRRWVCDEVGRQSQGLTPRPWAEPAVGDVPVDPYSAELAELVRGSSLACVAADSWNRIVAVSPAAAALLGWAAPDLEGRRVVTIIPPRWRERHIAGFTNHLLGGPTHIVGSTVRLTALHHDGHELDLDVRIDRADTAGRPCFVATMTLPE
jgi:PAS domain S-box-containing protein